MAHRRRVARRPGHMRPTQAVSLLAASLGAQDHPRQVRAGEGGEDPHHGKELRKFRSITFARVFN